MEFDPPLLPAQSVTSSTVIYLHDALSALRDEKPQTAELILLRICEVDPCLARRIIQLFEHRSFAPIPDSPNERR